VALSEIDISFAVVLDDLCSAIDQAGRTERPLTTAAVAPEIYGIVVEAKQRQHLMRGNPLMLLALELEEDPSLDTGDFVLR
jgi:hypothetical protein